MGIEINRSRLDWLTRPDPDGLKSSGFLAVNNVSWAKGTIGKTGQHLTRKAGHDTDTDEREKIAKTLSLEQTSFAGLLIISQHKLCENQRDRVYGMLSLAAPKFRNDITVSYKRELRELYIETGKACLKHDNSLLYLRLQAGRLKMPGLPSWCANLNSPPVDVGQFNGDLRAGLRDEDPEVETTILVSHDSDAIGLVGFRADQVQRIVPPYPNPRDGLVVGRLIRRGAWLADCLSLLQTTLEVNRADEDDIPLAHVYAVTASTLSRVPDSKSLKQSYKDIIRNISSQTHLPPGTPLGTPPYLPPEDRKPLFNDTDTWMSQVCPGRAYFTTAEGRVGIGPPDMKEGDVVAVVYGGDPVYILRENVQTRTFEFVGDAFVHGLMELSRTPVEAIRPDEWFHIV